MKKVVTALILALASTTALAGTKSADYTACQANAKEAFGADAIVKSKRFRNGKIIELWVTTKDEGRFVAVCNRESLAVAKK